MESTRVKSCRLGFVKQTQGTDEMRYYIMNTCLLRLRINFSPKNREHQARREPDNCVGM